MGGLVGFIWIKCTKTIVSAFVPAMKAPFTQVCPGALDTKVWLWKLCLFERWTFKCSSWHPDQLLCTPILSFLIQPIIQAVFTGTLGWSRFFWLTSLKCRNTNAFVLSHSVFAHFKLSLLFLVHDYIIPLFEQYWYYLIACLFHKNFRPLKTSTFNFCVPGVLHGVNLQ